MTRLIPPQPTGARKGTRDAYGETLRTLGAEIPEIVALDCDLEGSTRTGWFKKEYPDRHFNLGVAEQDMISMAAGLALEGFIPFASTFAIFATGRAWEQVRTSICLNRANVKIVATHGGITVGEDGASHQIIEDFANMRAIPNQRVICPADAAETAAVIRTVAATEGPFYVRLSRWNFPVLFPETYPFELGRAALLREGNDLALIACGVGVSIALEAAERLAGEGVACRVYNMSSLKPIDTAAIVEAATQTRGIVTVEEHNVLGGLGGAVAEVVTEHAPCPVKRVGIQDTFGATGTPQELLTAYGVSPEAVVVAAQSILQASPHGAH